MKGPAIFLAQFLRDEAPFDRLDTIARWAADKGYADRFRPGTSGYSTSSWPLIAKTTAITIAGI